VKWLHAGRAAEGGVTAAYLARNGFTGPPTVLEGRFGFCKVFSDEPEPDRLLMKLGEDFAIRTITVKPYACCSDIHPVIDALLHLKATNNIDIDAISCVRVGGPEKLIRLNDLDGTQSILAAKYSVPLTIGITLSRDIRNPAVYDDALLNDKGLRAFQKKVHMFVEKDIDELYPKVISARVIVELIDGTTLRAESLGALGTVHKPLSNEQIVGKFRTNVGSVMSRARANEMIELVDKLESQSDIARLTALLRLA
jgi:2-methylcitrate dehydratase PrpD